MSLALLKIMDDLKIQNWKDIESYFKFAYIQNSDTITCELCELSGRQALSYKGEYFVDVLPSVHSFYSVIPDNKMEKTINGLKWVIYYLKRLF